MLQRQREERLFPSLTLIMVIMVVVVKRFATFCGAPSLSAELRAMRQETGIGAIMMGCRRLCRVVSTLTGRPARRVQQESRRCRTDAEERNLRASLMPSRQGSLGQSTSKWTPSPQIAP